MSSINHLYAAYAYLFPVISSSDSITGESNNGKESYTYVFQLCGDAGGVPGAGVIQIDNNKKGSKPTVIGTFESTQAVGESKFNIFIQILKKGLIAFITFKCKYRKSYELFFIWLSWQVTG